MHIRPWIVFALIAFLGVLPLLIALLAGVIADRAKCDLNEGSVSPCIIAGRDFGALLYSMFVGGWFVFFTMPAALGLTLIYGMYLWFKR